MVWDKSMERIASMLALLVVACGVFVVGVFAVVVAVFVYFTDVVQSAMRVLGR
jgi:hypothetical protein